MSNLSIPHFKIFMNSSISHLLDFLYLSCYLPFHYSKINFHLKLIAVI